MSTSGDDLASNGGSPSALRLSQPVRAAHTISEVELTDMGTQLKIAGEIEEAMQCYVSATQINPEYSPAWYNIGVTLSECGRNIVIKQFRSTIRLRVMNEKHIYRSDDALEAYKTALLYNPRHPEAACNIGVIMKNAGKLEEAIHYYEASLAANASFDLAQSNLAIALTDLGTRVKGEGRRAEGIKHYKRALLYNFRYADAYYNLGVAYRELGKIKKAVYYYHLAITFKPTFSEAHNNLGVIYKDRNELDKAVACYSSALHSDPTFTHSLNNLAVIYTVQGKVADALQLLQRAVKANPSYAEAFNNIGVLYRDIGNIPKAIEQYERCLSLDTDDINAGQNRLLSMNYVADGDNYTLEDVFEQHLNWAKSFEKKFARRKNWSNTKDTDRQLRVGYLSPDLFTHSVSYFIHSLISCADKENFFVACYANVASPDAKTQVLKEGSDLWRNVFGKSTEEVCAYITDDKIDILIELAGHTANNRLDVMACKPAPVQVTYIGYPNTTGLSTIDYRFSDEVADPITSNQQYSETLVRLPRCFLCYTPPAAAPSRLLLKCKPFACEETKKSVIAQFEKRGVTQERLILCSLMPFTHQHLSLYDQMDVSLDTFPFAGASLSKSVGLNQFVASTEEEYVKFATKCSTTEGIAQLAALRPTLRQIMLESPLCDGKGASHAIEAEYRKMWRKYCNT